MADLEKNKFEGVKNTSDLKGIADELVLKEVEEKKVAAKALIKKQIEEIKERQKEINFQQRLNNDWTFKNNRYVRREARISKNKKLSDEYVRNSVRLENLKRLNKETDILISAEDEKKAFEKIYDEFIALKSGDWDENLEKGSLQTVEDDLNNYDDDLKVNLSVELINIVLEKDDERQIGSKFFGSLIDNLVLYEGKEKEKVNLFLVELLDNSSIDYGVKIDILENVELGYQKNKVEIVLKEIYSSGLKEGIDFIHKKYPLLELKFIEKAKLVEQISEKVEKNISEGVKNVKPVAREAQDMDRIFKNLRVVASRPSDEIDRTYECIVELRSAMFGGSSNARNADVENVMNEINGALGHIFSSYLTNEAKEANYYLMKSLPGYDDVEATRKKAEDLQSLGKMELTEKIRNIVHNHPDASNVGVVETFIQFWKNGSETKKLADSLKAYGYDEVNLDRANKNREIWKDNNKELYKEIESKAEDLLLDLQRAYSLSLSDLSLFDKKVNEMFKFFDKETLARSDRWAGKFAEVLPKRRGRGSRMERGWLTELLVDYLVSNGSTNIERFYPSDIEEKVYGVYFQKIEFAKNKSDIKKILDELKEFSKGSKMGSDFILGTKFSLKDAKNDVSTWLERQSRFWSKRFYLNYLNKKIGTNIKISKEYVQEAFGKGVDEVLTEFNGYWEKLDQAKEGLKSSNFFQELTVFKNSILEFQTALKKKAETDLYITEQRYHYYLPRENKTGTSLNEKNKLTLAKAQKLIFYREINDFANNIFSLRKSLAKAIDYIDPPIARYSLVKFDYYLSELTNLLIANSALLEKEVSGEMLETYIDSVKILFRSIEKSNFLTFANNSVDLMFLKIINKTTNIDKKFHTAAIEVFNGDEKLAVEISNGFVRGSSLQLASNVFDKFLEWQRNDRNKYNLARKYLEDFFSRNPKNLSQVKAEHLLATAGVDSRSESDEIKSVRKLIKEAREKYIGEKEGKEDSWMTKENKLEKENKRIDEIVEKVMFNVNDKFNHTSLGPTLRKVKETLKEFFYRIFEFELNNCLLKPIKPEAEIYTYEINGLIMLNNKANWDQFKYHKHESILLEPFYKRLDDSFFFSVDNFTYNEEKYLIFKISQYNNDTKSYALAIKYDKLLIQAVPPEYEVLNEKEFAKLMNRTEKIYETWVKESHRGG